MLKTISKHLAIFMKFRQLALMKMMETRTDFYFWVAVSLLWTAFNFFFFGLIIMVKQSIAGWSTWELYLLLSVFTMLDSLTWSVMYKNMNLYTQLIFKGSLSLHLLKPVDTQFILMVQENSYSNVPRLLVGLGGVVYSLIKLQITPTLWTIVLFFISFLSASILLYSVWFICATCAFWVEKLDNINEVIPGLRRIWMMPADIFQGKIATFLTLIFPLAMLTTLPTGLLIGKFSVYDVLYFCLISLVFFLFSRLFFQVSLRQFTSTGN